MIRTRARVAGTSRASGPTRARLGARTRLGTACLAAAVGLATAGCAGNPPLPEDIDGGGVSHVERTLADYRQAGFLTGTPSFPVIGRVVTFRGPGDSAFVALTASFSPVAMRFARERDLFTARYQVLATAVAGGDTVRRMDRREVVRVEDFTETASDDERIFFQRFLTLPPGEYDLSFTVRELSSREQASRTFRVSIPGPDDPPLRLTEPVVALRALARRSYRQEPPLIISPRSTVAASREPPSLVVEVYDTTSSALRLRVTDDDRLLWEQDMVAEAPPDGEAAPRTALTTLPVSRIPPGLARLSVSTRGGAATHGPLLLALDDVWAFAEWGDVVGHLAYAIDPDSLESWERADLSERARLWSDFWDATDLDPATPRNEFLGRYFDRMSHADDRYAEPGTPGWRTDRGRAYVQLGEPESEEVFGGGETGTPLGIEWRYEASLPFLVVLRYVDTHDFGVFRLDPRSRLVLRNAARRLRELERTGEWTDTRGTEDEDDDGIG